MTLRYCVAPLTLLGALILRLLSLLVTLLLTALMVLAQQVADDSFHYENPNPAFEPEAGPVVCVDSAHHNFHTADGRYKAFADLLRGDGYRVKNLSSTFTHQSLAECPTLVIANPGATEHDPWAYPHDSAFTREEISELLGWVRGGGALALIIDHQPVPGVTAGLGMAFGVVMLDGIARGQPDAEPPDLFQREDGTLKPHPISEGRNLEERVDVVGTFTGHAFLPSQEFQPLLVFGPEARGHADLEEHDKELGEQDWPQFSIAGWSHGATREWGRGRVIILGEAAMCTTQLVGPNRRPMGMNHPAAFQNARFCLNMVRWLTGVLK